MGAGTPETLTEIEQIRAGLDAKLVELQNRLPAPLRVSRKAVAAVVGGTVGGTAIMYVARRLAGGRTKKRSSGKSSASVTPVVVNVFPPGALAAAVAGIGVWAGVRVFEAVASRPRSTPDTGPSAVVRSLDTPASGTA